ncbi:hypothetical protein F4780DRAFT_70399 [Xylariomycetidae sp. FL0641]|nr:hypothetical protein F4780DRAFT_70399 [Xylariomycetidae sp. FL0641]
MTPKDTIMTLKSVNDLAVIVTRAVPYEGRWPKIGGIRGNRLTSAQVIAVSKKVRCKSRVLSLSLKINPGS